MNLTANLYYDELVDRCKNGDQAGYAMLYQRYARAMFNTSLRIVNNRADAEDILQESFLAAFRLENFDYSSTFGAWLKRIVVNKSIDVIRRRHRGAAELEEIHTGIPAEEAMDDSIPPGLTVEKIKEALIGLPAGYRAVLSLYLFEDYSYGEIAALLQVSEVTVRTQYHRGRKKLQELLQKGGTV